MLQPLRGVRPLPAAVVFAIMAGSAHASPLPLTDGKWELKGDGIALGRHDGRDVIDVRDGIAYRRDVRLEDGAIEFDVQLTRRRSFVYLMFRMEDDRDYEEIYLRPHKSGLPDALQYAPVYQGQSAWQLYHGPGATAAVAFEPGVWTRVRILLGGRRAEVYVGGGAEPVLRVPRLGREPHTGYIALSAFTTEEDVKGPIARFANIAARPGPVALPSAASPPAPLPGVVQAWAVSRAFAPKEGGEEGLPSAAAVGPYSVADALPAGLVELHRFVRLPEGSRGATAVARVTVRATSAGRYAFELGFSDNATLFVNGQPLFRGQGRYSYDAPRREGLIGFDQARVWIPLREGDNEVAVVVTDFFGGWGLMGRFLDATGLTVKAS